MVCVPEPIDILRCGPAEWSEILRRGARAWNAWRDDYPWIIPDLTGIAGRFSNRDLLETIVDPSKVVSDQYAAVVIQTVDGQTITGRIINLSNDNMDVNTDMLAPGATVKVDRREVVAMKPSTISMMPTGLLDTLHDEEVLDLVAFLLSRGDRKSPMFKGP